MIKPETAQRFLSVDTLRGLTIAFMILVNDPGDSRHTYAPLEHADWNGWTPTDLVFPNFLFLVGCSIVFSVDSRLARGVTRRDLTVQIARRALIILLIKFAMGLLPHFHLANMRIFGVLTRIALCYFAVGLLYLVNRRTQTLIAITTMLLIGYWVLLRFVPVPGFGLPVRDVPLLDQVGNLTSWMDRGFTTWTQRWLHTGTLYRRTSDPEGVLSTLPAIATTLMGVIAAKLLTGTKSANKVDRTQSQTTLILLAAGALCVFAGLVWGSTFPINKNLWTSSFVLLAGGFSLAGLAVAYWVFDVTRSHERSPLMRALSWPLLVFGSNAIIAYVVSGMLVDIAVSIHLPGMPANMNLWRATYMHLFAFRGSTENTSLAFAIAVVLVCFVPNWLLWRKRIFVRV